MATVGNSFNVYNGILLAPALIPTGQWAIGTYSIAAGGGFPANVVTAYYGPGDSVLSSINGYSLISGVVFKNS